MSYIDHDSDAVRKYLLGQLSEDQQQDFVQRLLAEDELTQDLEVTTEELIDEYLTRQLTPEESEWFEQHFLASPQGQKSQRVAQTLHRYFSNKEPIRRSWAERLSAFWNRQAVPLRTAAALAVVVVVVGVVWFSLPGSPRSFATITLTNSSATRSAGVDSRRISLREDVLRLTLMLPETKLDGGLYRAEVTNESGAIKAIDASTQDGKSVTLEIRSSELRPGSYSVTLHAKSADGTSQRIPGNYFFTIE